MVNINSSENLAYGTDNTVLIGPATHVEMNGKHYVITHWTNDPIGSGAQEPDGLRVYEVTENSGNWDLVTADQVNYSVAGSGLGVDFPYGSAPPMTVFEKGGATYLAQNTYEKYIVWSIDNNGDLSHETTIDKPDAIDGNMILSPLKVHVANDDTVTLMETPWDPSIHVYNAGQPTDHSFWMTELDSNFNLQSPISEVGHSVSQAATTTYATANLVQVDIGDNESLLYGVGHIGHVPVWKIDATGTVSELAPITNLTGIYNKPFASGSYSSSFDTVYNPVDDKVYMVGTHPDPFNRGIAIYEVNQTTGALTNIANTSNTGRVWHAVDDEDANTAYDDGYFWETSSADSIQLGVDEATGDLIVIVSGQSDGEINVNDTGSNPSDAYAYGGVSTYRLDYDSGNYGGDITIFEGTMGGVLSGRYDQSTTFEMNGQTITVGFDAWGTDGDQPHGGWSIWGHDTAFASPPVCFVQGTRILTPDGPVAIEHLSAGDRVITRSGTKTIRWIGSSLKQARGKLAPIRIRAGSLGNGLPARDLLVSRQHRIVVSSELAQRKFGTSEVLISAVKLTELEGVEIVSGMRLVEYFHMLFDKHEIVYAESTPAESLYPGAEAEKSLSQAALAELEEVFPDLFKPGAMKPALPIPPNAMQKRIARAKRMFLLRACCALAAPVSLP